MLYDFCWVTVGLTYGFYRRYCETPYRNPIHADDDDSSDVYDEFAMTFGDVSMISAMFRRVSHGFRLVRPSRRGHRIEGKQLRPTNWGG